MKGASKMAEQQHLTLDEVSQLCSRALTASGLNAEAAAVRPL